MLDHLNAVFEIMVHLKKLHNGLFFGFLISIKLKKFN